MMNKLERIKRAMGNMIAMFDEGVPESDWGMVKSDGRKAAAELKEVMDRFNSEELNTDMQIAYNQILLNQPEDCRDATKAMRAAINIIRGKDNDK